jgi:hypothetical protein
LLKPARCPEGVTRKIATKKTTNKESTKVGGSCRACKDQASGFEENFLLCLFFRGKNFSSKILTTPSRPPGQRAFFFFCFFLLKIFFKTLNQNQV